MLEEIKKEIATNSYYDNTNIKVVDLDDLFTILDKYKDKEKLMRITILFMCKDRLSVLNEKEQSKRLKKSDLELKSFVLDIYNEILKYNIGSDKDDK